MEISTLVLIKFFVVGLYLGFGICYRCFLASHNETILGNIHPDDRWLLIIISVLLVPFWPLAMWARYDELRKFFD